MGVGGACLDPEIYAGDAGRLRHAPLASGWGAPEANSILPLAHGSGCQPGQES